MQGAEAGCTAAGRRAEGAGKALIGEQHRDRLVGVQDRPVPTIGAEMATATDRSLPVFFLATEQSPRRREVMTMPTKSHGPGIKDPERYEALREKGMSKEKAARISN